MAKAGSENPLGLGLIILGTVVISIAAFLPFAEPIGPFAVVRSNTLIQHDGWLLIVVAVAIAASGYWAYKRNANEWMVPTILCLIAAAGTVIIAYSKDLRTLYPVGPDGVPDTSKPGEVAILGIATYVAGAGVALALIGSLMLRRSPKQALDASDEELADWWASQNRPVPMPAPATTKKCPDCAETILIDAHVCKHCGYRFTRSAPSAPHKPHGKSSKVRCHHCQHVQSVPLNQPTFVCEQCNTKLTRAHG